MEDSKGNERCQREWQNDPCLDCLQLFCRDHLQPMLMAAWSLPCIHWRPKGQNPDWKRPRWQCLVEELGWLTVTAARVLHNIQQRQAWRTECHQLPPDKLDIMVPIFQSCFCDYNMIIMVGRLEVSKCRCLLKVYYTVPLQTITAAACKRLSSRISFSLPDFSLSVEKPFTVLKCKGEKEALAPGSICSQQEAVLIPMVSLLRYCYI